MADGDGVEQLDTEKCHHAVEMKQEKDELQELQIHFQQPSSPVQMKSKKTKSKGRKAKKPVKRSHHRSGLDEKEGNLYHCYQEEDGREAEEDRYEDEVEIQEDSREEEADSLISSPMKHLKWDKRMRLTITKDFRKGRKQNQLDGTKICDDRPAQRTFTCTVCKQAFLQASDCLEHMYTHSREGTHISSDLDREDRLENGEEEEEDAEVEETAKEFGIDGEIPNNDLDDQAEEKKKALWCSLCQEDFSSKRELHRHRLLQHKGEKCFECPVCKKFYPSASTLALHRRNHLGVRPFKCDIDDCDRTFSDASSLNRHRRTHSEERPFICQHCGKAFKMQNHLREHVRLHTGEKPFVCEYCGAGFAQSNGLKSHAKRHKVTRLNECDICHKAFSHASFLTLHKKIHSGDKPYVCDVCDRKFRTACNLGAHKKLKHETVVRKEGKDFTCDVCGASFTHACNLGIHKKKKHSGIPVTMEKNYACDICDMKFSAPCNLGAHKKIKHAEEVNDGRNVFGCDICGGKFYRACNLSGHKRRKHGDTGEMKESDKLFVCDLCNLRCSTMENLQEHQSKIHYSSSASEIKDSFDRGLSKSKSQPPTMVPFNTSFDDQQQSEMTFKSFNSCDDLSMSLDLSDAEQPTPFTNVTLASADSSDKICSQGSVLGQTEAALASVVLEQPRNKHAFNPPSFGDDSKTAFDQLAAFESGLPASPVTNQHMQQGFALDVGPSSCHICGVMFSDKASLVHHLEMHTRDKFFQDVFSVQ